MRIANKLWRDFENVNKYITYVYRGIKIRGNLISDAEVLDTVSVIEDRIDYNISRPNATICFLTMIKAFDDLEFVIYDGSFYTTTPKAYGEKVGWWRPHPNKICRPDFRLYKYDKETLDKAVQFYLESMQ